MWPAAQLFLGRLAAVTTSRSRLVRSCAALAAGLSLTLAPVATAQTAPTSQQIRIVPCPPHVTVESAQCGEIDVPMDYADPEGEQITLGFLRVPAENPEARRGVLFGNPGGPGGDAYSYFGIEGAVLWPEEINDEWDRIAVQPRGLQHSTPLECAEPAMDTPLDAARVQAESTLSFGGLVRDLCEQTRPGYTRTITTETNARDWNAVREALGEDEISIMGLSYGTYIGSTYATLYPEHTNRVVLDSAMDPTVSWEQLLAEQQHGYQGALNDYFTWVAANDETYHMGDTPLKAYQYWSNEIAKETGTNPTVAPPPAQVGDLPPELAFTGQAGADALTATGAARVEAEGIVSRAMNPGASQANSELYLATHQLAPAPQAWDTLARVTNGSFEAPEDAGEPDPALIEEMQAQQIAGSQLQAVQICNESISAPDYSLLPAAFWAQHTGDLFTLPFATYGSGLGCNGAGPVTTGVELDGSQLENQPLQFNATGDPQTPYDGRFGIAEPMLSHLVTIHGPGHGHVGMGNPAVDEQVVRFLQTGELGPVDQPGFFEANAAAAAEAAPAPAEEEVAAAE